MSATLLAVIVDCHDPLRVAEFRAEALAWKVTERNTDEYRVSDPAGHDPGLYFMKVPEPRTGKNRLHLDILTAGPLEDEVARLVGAGAVLGRPGRTRPHSTTRTPGPCCATPRATSSA